MKTSLLAGLFVLSGFALNAYSFTDNFSGRTFFSCPYNALSETSASDPVNAEVYPNPTSDLVYLQFGEHASGSYVIEVFNTLGQQLSTQNFTASPSAKATVSLSSFADGIYFISVKKADGTQTSTYRITKNS